MLNVKLNQRLWESGRIDNHHTYPNPGDSGIAVGAALHAYFQANPNAQIHPIQDLYWGPEYSNTEIEDALKLRQLEYERIENPAEVAGEALAQDKIVGWFQGRMESGPRALGARSILMSANKPENKDIINARVKFREAFRPFCPSLLWERKEDYLENARDEFFMITSFTCKPEKRDRVPAVVHADNMLTADDLPRIIEAKRNLLESAGSLESISVNVRPEEIGGLDNLKQWLKRRRGGMTAKARAFGLDWPRGILLLGVQGCGKSLAACST